MFSIDNDDNNIKQKVSVPVYWQKWEYLSFLLFLQDDQKRLPIVSRLPIDQWERKRENNRIEFFCFRDILNPDSILSIYVLMSFIRENLCKLVNALWHSDQTKCCHQQQILI